MRLEPPESVEAGLRDALRRANASGSPLSPSGRSTRTLLGPERPEGRLSTHGLDLIDLDAEERVATVDAGVALRPLLDRLNREGLTIASLEPKGVLESWGFGTLYEGTLGGYSQDPRELPNWPRFGRLRDITLGLEAFRGDATPFRTGGRVVKNVTGYDLTRFLIGARGQLGLVRRLHLKLTNPPRHRVDYRSEPLKPEKLIQRLRQLRQTTSLDPLVRVTLGGDDARLELALSGDTAWVTAQSAKLKEFGGLEPVDPIEVEERELGTFVYGGFRDWCELIESQGECDLREAGKSFEAIYPFAQFGVLESREPDALRDLFPRLEARGFWLGPETRARFGLSSPRSLQPIEARLLDSWDPERILAWETRRD